MTSKDDKELTNLLTKLYAIQEDVGAKPKTTDEEKRNKAENSSMMGKSRGSKKKGSRFVELKSTIIERLRKVHSLLEEDHKRDQGLMGSVVTGGNNPKEVIARQAEMREEIRQATEEWKELDGLYKSEARKKRSKFTQEQLETQQTLVRRLSAEIEKVKEIQSQGYARRDKDSVVATINSQTLASLNAATLNATDNGDGTTSWAAAASAVEGPGVELTQSQALKIKQIEKRDQDFDQELDKIGDGIKDLHEIAQLQSEEVRRQGAMLESVEGKIDKAAEHITSVNANMKETLEEARAADKICVDIMCIMLMVGLGAVMYHMVKQN